MEPEKQYNMITESLRLLSASECEQKERLGEFADVPDDVISDFENAFLLLPQLIDSNKFSYRSIASILRLYNKMQWCLRNVELDDFSNAEWNSVRELAKDTLQIIQTSSGNGEKR